LSFAHGIVSGMNYLHSLQDPVIHSDLKPENVLIGDKFVVKVSHYYSVMCSFLLNKVQFKFIFSGNGLGYNFDISATVHE